MKLGNQMKLYIIALALVPCLMHGMNDRVYNRAYNFGMNNTFVGRQGGFTEQNNLAELRTKRLAMVNKALNDFLKEVQTGKRNAKDINNLRINELGGYDYKTLLSIAAKSGDKELVQKLLSNGADINKGGDGLSEKVTPLIDAINYFSIPNPKSGNIEIIKMLINAGANVNDKDEEHSSIFYAAKQGNKQVMQLLLDKGAKIDNVIEFMEDQKLFFRKTFENILPFIKVEDYPRIFTLQAIKQAFDKKYTKPLELMLRGAMKDLSKDQAKIFLQSFSENKEVNQLYKNNENLKFIRMIYDIAKENKAKEIGKLILTQMQTIAKMPFDVGTEIASFIPTQGYTSGKKNPQGQTTIDWDAVD